MALKRYLFTLPERLVRSIVGLGAGVAREVGDLALPQSVRQSRLYQTWSTRRCASSSSKWVKSRASTSPTRSSPMISWRAAPSATPSKRLASSPFAPRRYGCWPLWRTCAALGAI